MYQVKQRVLTCRGLGTVEGFERFDSKGNTAPVSLTDTEDSTARVIVALDHPERWSLGTVESPHPYMYRRDLRALDGLVLKPLTPTAYPDNMAATLSMRCHSCDRLKAYELAREAGWTYDPDGPALEAYYCEVCTAEVRREVGHA